MSKNPLPNKITQFYDPLKIKWKLSYGKEVKEINTSEHRVYVTLDKPNNKLDELYLTLLHLATSNSGAEDKAKAVENTWKLFANPTGENDLTTWDPDRPLYFYKEGKGFNDCITHNVGHFLTSSTGNGACNAFVELFMESLLVNGLTESEFKRVHVHFSEADKKGQVMVMRKWEPKVDPEKGPRLKNKFALHHDGVYSTMVPVPAEKKTVTQFMGTLSIYLVFLVKTHEHPPKRYSMIIG